MRMRNRSSLLFLVIALPAEVVAIFVLNRVHVRLSDALLLGVVVLAMLPALAAQVIYERRHRDDDGPSPRA